MLKPFIAPSTPGKNERLESGRASAFHGHVLPTPPPHDPTGTLIHYSKRDMFNMLVKAGVKEDEAMQLLANYRRPYPGFYEPDDPAYAEDAENAQPAEAMPGENNSQDAPPLEHRRPFG